MVRTPHAGQSDRPPPLPPEPATPHFVVADRHHAWKRIGRTVGAIAATGATLLAATAAGVVVHVGTPPARRLAAAAVNTLLTGTFRGKIDVVQVAHLQLDGVDGAVATLTDPDGQRVALVEGVRARIALLPLLGSILTGANLRVRVTELSIDHIDVLLRQEADGTLTIAEAFQPAVAGPPPPPDENASGLDLTLAKISLRHAWVHGGVSALPLLDADIDDLTGSFDLTPDKTSVDVRTLRVATRAMPQRADLALNVRAKLAIPTETAHTSASGSIAGTVGGIDARLGATLEGTQVDAVLDLPEVMPSQLDDLLGDSPVKQRVSAHVEAHGPLPHLDPRIHLTVGDGTIDLGGHVTLPTEGQSDTLARITVAARNLDARAVSATAPASKLGLDLSGTARLAADGAADGTYSIHVLPGRVGAQTTPEARIAGTFSPTAIRATADLFASELGGAVRGRVAVHADGELALRTKRVTAHLKSKLDAIDAGGIGFDHADVSADVRGPLGAPAAAVAIAGRGLHAANYAYPAFQVEVTGGMDELFVHADLHGGKEPSVVAKATVGTRGGIDARDVLLTVAKDKDRLAARLEHIRSTDGKTDVDGIRIEGAGDPIVGELHLRPGGLKVRLATSRANLPTLLRVAGIETDLRDGDAALDVDLDATPRATTGHANVALQRVTYGGAIRGLDAELGATFDGQSAALHLDAHDAEKNAVTLETEDGHLTTVLDPRAWARATGRVHGTANIDLARLNASAPGALPFDELRGRLTAKVDVARDDAKRRPTITIDAATRGLVLTTEPATIPAGDRTVVVVGRPIHSQGLDAQVKASFDGETGKAGLDALLGDAQGHLIEANGSTTLPMKAILAGDPREALLSTPMRAHVEMPIRSVGAIPALFASVPVSGKIGLTLDAEGTARDPHVQALLHGREITDAGDPSPIPISLDAAAFYDGTVARAKITALHAAQPVMDVTASIALRAKDVLAGSVPWEANAEAHFTQFPIGSVTGFVDENQMDGDLNGSVVVRDLHKSGQLDVDLDLSKVAINGAKFGDTKATARMRDGALEADAEITQPDGSAGVHLTSGLGWGDAVTPTLDAAKPVDIALRAKNFRLAMLAPFVRSVVSELDGRLNADTKLHVLPGMKDGKMTGAIVIDRGLFETPTVGEELHNLRARIFMKPWGVWNVEEISADGTSGHFTANAVAHVNGLAFRSGEAHLRIAQKDRLPLAMQGMELGTVWGRIDAKGEVAQDKNRVDIDVSIPDFHVALPQSIAHGVQSTTPDPTIKVGSILPDGIVAILPVDGSLPPPAPPRSRPAPTAPPPPVIHITTHLGPDLEVRRDTTVRAYVTEGPTIDIGKETKISGGISIPRGYIELQGKRFQIEKGKITFTGQPVDDPVVVATASYESPDGTKVFADFIGPVKTGKLTLHSEPQLSQNEILSLLLFGSADGTFGQSAPPGQGGNDVTQAASLAGGVVTQGLNKAISGVSGVDVQTKVDTQETGDPRPEVEVALSREVSATIVYNLGVPPPGQNPDDTLLVVDWRFNKNYATEATVGDKGTSILDLTWKYRY